MLPLIRNQIWKSLKHRTGILSDEFWHGFLRIRLIYRGILSKVSPSLVAHEGNIKMPILVINLDHRVDRLKSITRFIEEIGVNGFERISAVHTEDGKIGCVASHLQAVNIGIIRRCEAVMICEDDIELLAQPAELLALVSEFLSSAELDVLCLGFNVRQPSIRFSESLLLTTDTQTASCYIVKKRALPVLQARFAKSLVKVAAGGSQMRYMHDMYWKKDQKRSLIFAHPAVRVVKQSRSYSDLEKQIVDYGV